MPLKCCYDPNLLNPSKGVIGLSKEIPYALVDQRAVKLQVLKVCPSWDSNLGRLKSSDSLYTLAVSKKLSNINSWSEKDIKI